jgi:glycosyl-4,4'-diaponeurosporenoate acyltransferase
MSDEAALALDITVWIVWGFTVGWVAHRLPNSVLAFETWLTQVRHPRRLRRWCEQSLRIKRWKPLLPEAGDLFKGGFSKRRLGSATDAHLERFVIETRRAEYAHAANVSIVPLFFLWNPWWLAVVMAVYGIGANTPCWVVQRYNRVRLGSVLDRSRRTAIRS